MRQSAKGKENASKRRVDFKEYLEVGHHRGKLDIRGAGDNLWVTLEITNTSRFSSEKRLPQSGNSGGIREIDASKLKIKGKILPHRAVFAFR